MTRGVIVFDGGVLRVRPRTGVARAFLATLSAYAKLAEFDCVMLVTSATPDIHVDGLRVVRTNAVGGPLARQFALPRLLSQLGASLLHSPVAAIPWRAPCPVIATIHDLPWRAAVRLDERGTGPRDRLAVRVALRRATAIIVPSRATRVALLDEAGAAPAAPIHIVPHGVEPPATPARADALIGPFLAFGDARPRKNVERVRRAHARARAARADLPPLRVIGPGLEWLEDVERDAALRSARCLIAASLHEGFGLPVLEAMGHGVPVLCSTWSSLPEVAGDAALMIEPTDEASIAAALTRLHDDDGLRATLRTRGLARAATMTPAHSAAGWRALHSEWTA